MPKSFMWGALIVIVSVTGVYLYWKDPGSIPASRGEVVQLVFELDKKVEFGEYYFDINNGEKATYPLCFCLTERNMFPPDCYGDVKYIYNNTPGTMCVPLNIATGRCSTRIMSSSSFATMFLIPLEYAWTKPVEKIVMGIRVPLTAPVGSRLEVRVNIFRRDDLGRLVIYRNYKKSILVKKSLH
ncbi:MAG: hypothetical protein ABIN89_15745 [Chitinophagaceae bacterium]